MSVFIVYSTDSLPDNSGKLLENYLINKLNFTEILESNDNKLIAFLGKNCHAQKADNDFQLIWGEITAIEDKILLRKKDAHDFVTSIWNKKDFERFSNIDGSWGFCKYIKGKLYLSKGAYTTSSVSPDLFYFKKNNFFFISSNINYLVPLIANDSFHMGSVLSCFRFGAPAPGKTLFKEIKRLESGNIYTILDKEVIPKINIQNLIKREWWSKYANHVPLEEAVEDLNKVNVQNMKNILPSYSVPSITLSGGIDSASLASGIFQTKFKDNWLGIYGHKSNENMLKTGDKLNELESSRFIANKKKGRHISIDMMEYADTRSIEKFVSSFEGFCWPTGYQYQLLAKAAKDNGKNSIILGSGEDLAPASHIFQEWLLRKKLEHNYIGKLGWSLLQNLSKNRFYRGVLSRIFNIKELIINPHGEITWFHEQISSLLLNRFLKELVAKKDLIESGAVVLPNKDIYEKLPIKSVWAYVSSINYYRTLPDLWSGIAAQASSGTGVNIYNIFAGQHFAKYIVALPKHFKTGEGLTGTNGKNWNKFLFRKLIEKEVGPEIAWRERYGFSNPIWHKFRKELKMEQVINDIKIFDNDLIKKKILITHPRKHYWTMFTLAKIKDKFNSTKKEKIF